jgi:hypothetical protein
LRSASARRFVAIAREAGETWLGAPSTPIRRVDLRYTGDSTHDGGAGASFQLAHLADADRGHFVLFVSVTPEAPAFFGQLAHETFHLYLPRLRDAYVEGICTLLAEKLLRREGLPWNRWQEHFRAGREPFYAQTYWLVRDLERWTGTPALLSIVRFTSPRDDDGDDGNRDEPHEAESPRVAIDPDAWIASLAEHRRATARDVILGRFATIEALRRKTHSEYTFTRPSAP